MYPLRYVYAALLWDSGHFIAEGLGVDSRYSIIVQTCVAVFVPLVLGGKVEKGRATGDVVIKEDSVTMMGGYCGGFWI